MADGTAAELVNATQSAAIMRWIFCNCIPAAAVRHFSDFSRKKTFRDSRRVSKSPRDSMNGTNFL